MSDLGIKGFKLHVHVFKEKILIIQMLSVVRKHTYIIVVGLDGRVPEHLHYAHPPPAQQ